MAEEEVKEVQEEKVAPVELLDVTEIKVGDRGRKDVGDVMGLAASIEEIGLLNPIVIDDEKNLIAGYRRLMAHILLGKQKIQVRHWGTLSALERKKIELEENIKRKQLTWQEEISMKAELHELMVLTTPPIPHSSSTLGQPPKAWGLQQTADLLGQSLAQVSQDVSLARAIKDMPELKSFASKTNARRMFRHQLEVQLLIEKQSRAATKGSVLGEVQCVDGVDGLIDLKNGSVDLIITDPPWGIDIDSTAREWVRLHQSFNDEGVYARDVTDKVLTESHRVLKDGSHLYLFCAWQLLLHWQMRLTDLGFWVRPAPLIWVKGNTTAGQPYWKFMPKTECIIFAHKGMGGRVLAQPSSDVLQYDAPRHRIHPTQKPVDLLRYLITLSTVKGEFVLDPFAGSGSTIRAAILEERRGLGFEIDPEVCKKAALYLVTPADPQGE